MPAKKSPTQLNREIARALAKPYNVFRVLHEGTHRQSYEQANAEPLAYDAAARLRKQIAKTGTRVIIVNIATGDVAY